MCKFDINCCLRTAVILTSNLGYASISTYSTQTPTRLRVGSQAHPGDLSVFKRCQQAALLTSNFTAVYFGRIGASGGLAPQGWKLCSHSLAEDARPFPLALSPPPIIAEGAVSAPIQPSFVCNSPFICSLCTADPFLTIYSIITPFPFEMKTCY